jgi:hypothetical protein
MAKHINYKTTTGRHMTYSPISGTAPRHLSFDCLAETPHDCCKCGSCCISSISTIDVEWDLQGANMSCAEFDGIRTGSMTGLSLTSYNCEAGVFIDSPTWAKTVSGVEVVVTMLCGETPAWTVAITGPSSSSETANAENGNCCGFSGSNVPMNVSPACAGGNTGNAITVTIQNNKCCLNAEDACEEEFPVDCDGACDEGI